MSEVLLLTLHVPHFGAEVDADFVADELVRVLNEQREDGAEPIMVNLIPGPQWLDVTAQQMLIKAIQIMNLGYGHKDRSADTAAEAVRSAPTVNLEDVILIAGIPYRVSALEQITEGGKLSPVMLMHLVDPDPPAGGAPTREDGERRSGEGEAGSSLSADAPADGRANPPAGTIAGWGVWHVDDEDWVGFATTRSIAAEMIPDGSEYDHLFLRPAVARIAVGEIDDGPERGGIDAENIWADPDWHPDGPRGDTTSTADTPPPETPSGR